MAAFIRIGKDKWLNLEKVVTYEICRVSQEDYTNEHEEKFFMRFMLDCKSAQWIDTEPKTEDELEDLEIAIFDKRGEK